MVAAWMRADTGVGPSIASGSHTYSGIWADLPVAPTNRSSVTSDTVPNRASGASAAALRATSWKSRLPKRSTSSSMPSTNPRSPIRFTMKAFLPASDADRLRYQNPISRYEQRPTPSQPTNITRKFAARTSSSMNAAKRLRYQKYRAYSASVSSCM